jgi:hypothetical protein
LAHSSKPASGLLVEPSKSSQYRPKFCGLRCTLTSVVDCSDSVVALWWLEVLVVVDVVDVVDF